MTLRVLAVALALVTFAAPALIGPAAAQTAPPPPPRPAAPPPPPGPPAVSRPAGPDNPLPRIDAARKNYQAGKLLQALDDLNAALDAVNNQLVQRYAVTLPQAPAGWTVVPPDPQRAALMGGAAQGARDYQLANGQAMMNAHIVLDSDAIRQMTPLFGPTMPQGVPQTVRRVKIGAEDAVVAYDPQQRGGEVSVLVGGRILLQVDGQGVPSADPMIAAMRNWNIPELRRLAGM